MKHSLCLLLAYALLVACSGGIKDEEPLKDQINSVKSEYAPDKRVALFDIKATSKGNDIVLKGESNIPEAVEALKLRLKTDNIPVIDSITILPARDLEGKTRGIIKISVANLRSKPAHSSELATQATLGTPVKVFKKFENWYLVQTPDAYLAWVDSGGIHFMGEDEAEAWKAMSKVVFTQTFGHTFSKENEGSQVVSDIVAGGILEKISEGPNFFKVKYPDGRTAFVNKEEAQDYDLWLAQLNPTSESLVSTSKTLIGVPYLWGGTSTKGVDCSGFTKTIFFLNGMVIPRDASQQVHTGKAIDSISNFEKLIEGDLLFFGRKATDSTKEKVVHVGMWIGDSEFIHSSGRVQIGSMDKNAPNYDEYNYNRYLRSKRILKEEDEGLINLLENPLFKD